jgi:hypothetical protein
MKAVFAMLLVAGLVAADPNLGDMHAAVHTAGFNVRGYHNNNADHYVPHHVHSKIWKPSADCSITCELETLGGFGHIKVTHDTTSNHTHHFCHKVGCDPWATVGCSCQCDCCDETGMPAGWCDEPPRNYNESGHADSPAPTPAPTPVPTTYPTAHPCDDGSHGCDQNGGGICYEIDVGGRREGGKMHYGLYWGCDCASGYYCASGCTMPHSGHECVPITTAPTAYPTPEPTNYPTPYPTPTPTGYPTCGYDWQPMGDDIEGEAAFDTLGMRNSVDLAGNGLVLAVGSNEHDGQKGTSRNTGHVRAFDWNGGEWTQRGADIEGAGDFDYSGSAVELSAEGDHMAIGAHARGTGYGHVRIYDWCAAKDLLPGSPCHAKRNKQVWEQRGTDLMTRGKEKYDFHGASIDLSAKGDILAVGAYKSGQTGFVLNDLNMRNGSVRVYNWTGSDWQQLGGDIDGEEIYGEAGVTVDLSADGLTLAVGAHENNVEHSKYHAGHVRVYEWNGAHWNQRGDDINGEAQYDYSGSAIDLNDDGNIIAVGAYKNDGNGTDAGHVRTYMWNAGTSMWSQMGSDIDGQAAYDNFGVSVDLTADGQMLAVGAWGSDEGGVNSGHARVFVWNPYINEWVQKGDSVKGKNRWDHSGSSVDISADGLMLAVGAKYHSPSKDKRLAGHVQVYSTCAHLNIVKPTGYTDNLYGV